MILPTNSPERPIIRVKEGDVISLCNRVNGSLYRKLIFVKEATVRDQRALVGTIIPDGESWVTGDIVLGIYYFLVMV